MGKRNAKKHIELARKHWEESYINRKPVRPKDPPIVAVDGWAAYKHRYGRKDNQLWVPVKVVHVAALEGPKRRGTRRTFWLYFGIDARRFRRSNDHRLFQEQAPPHVYEAVLAACAARFTPERFEQVAGAAALADQRAKLEQSTAKRLAHITARLEAAHAAALEEDALWRQLYED